MRISDTHLQELMTLTIELLPTQRKDYRAEFSSAVLTGRSGWIVGHSSSAWPCGRSPAQRSKFSVWSMAFIASRHNEVKHPQSMDRRDVGVFGCVLEDVWVGPLDDLPEAGVAVIFEGELAQGASVSVVSFPVDEIEFLGLVLVLELVDIERRVSLRQRQQLLVGRLNRGTGNLHARIAVFSIMLRNLPDFEVAVLWYGSAARGRAQLVVAAVEVNGGDKRGVFAVDAGAAGNLRKRLGLRQALHCRDKPAHRLLAHNGVCHAGVVERCRGFLKLGGTRHPSPQDLFCGNFG